MRDVGNFHTVALGKNPGSLVVRKLQINGNYLKQIGVGIIKNLNSISMNSNGNIYAADPGKDTIFLFSPDGDLITQWSFKKPNSMIVTTDQFVVALDRNGGLWKFDSVGNKIDSITVTSSSKLIRGLNGDIFVQKEGSPWIKSYNKQLTLIDSFNVSSNGINSRNMQTVDSQGRLYFESDKWIGVFSQEKQFLGKFWPYLNSNTTAEPIVKTIGSTIYVFGYPKTNLAVKRFSSPL